MIDLDAVWTDKDELYCQFGAALCLFIISYDQWKSISEWTGCFKYIYPDRRVVASDLPDILYNKTKIRGAEVFRELWMVVRHIEAHYTEQDQIRIAAILEEANDSRMEKRPDFHGIIDVQEFEYDYGNPTS